jgi:hypothetical protein
MRWLILGLALAGCSTDGEIAARACAPIQETKAWGRCMGDYMDRLETQRSNEEAVVGGATLNGAFLHPAAPTPVFTSCTRVAGTVQCNSF